MNKEAIKVHFPLTIILMVLVIIICLTSCKPSKMVIINHNGLRELNFSVISYDNQLKQLIKRSAGIDCVSYRYYKRHPEEFKIDNSVRKQMIEN